jgi:hypothetical protein
MEAVKEAIRALHGSTIHSGLNGETFHISHSEFNKNAYGVFNERGNWHFAPTR